MPVFQPGTFPEAWRLAGTVNREFAMAVRQRAKIFDQVSIAAQIIDGSIQIDSIEEFNDILKLFPTDPALLRAYGDLLVKKQRLDEAAGSYGKAAELFTDAGMPLQAIVAKSLQWSLKPPSDFSAVKIFFATIEKAEGPSDAAGHFF